MDSSEIRDAISFLVWEENAIAALKKAGKPVEMPGDAPDTKIFMGQTFRLNPDKNKVYLVGENGEAYEFDASNVLDAFSTIFDFQLNRIKQIKKEKDALIKDISSDFWRETY
jgi:hypothetical protein